MIYLSTSTYVQQRKPIIDSLSTATHLTQCFTTLFYCLMRWMVIGSGNLTIERNIFRLVHLRPRWTLRGLQQDAVGVFATVPTGLGCEFLPIPDQVNPASRIIS